MAFQLRKGDGRPPVVRPEFTQVGDDRVIGSTVWQTDEGEDVERYQVITFRAGKIVDVQGCTSRREAERFANRR